MLGADAALGRTFGPEDESTTEPETVLLSWALWQRRYGGDRTIVGRRILINNQPGTVVGVMPAEFRLLLPPDASVPDDLQAWQPLNQADLRGGRRGQKYLRVVGRMQPDVTLDQARTEISGIASLISREFNPKGARRLFNTVGLQAEDVREVRPGLLALFGGVAILLLIACVNVASLLVARAAARTRETVLKRALGAGYGRLLRQCLVEGLLLATLGAVAGVVLARLGLTLLLTAKPESLSRISRVSIDSTVLAYTCGIALVWGLLFSLAPLTEVFRTDRAECGSPWLASCGICAIEALSKH